MKVLFVFALVIVFWSCNQSDSAKEETTSTDTSSAPATGSTDEVATQLPGEVPFQKEMSYGNIKFSVSSPGLSKANTFTLTPSGLSATNDPSTMDIDGLVSDLIVDDIDGDNAPEAAVIVKSGPDDNGKAYVFSSNNNKSLSMVNLPELTDSKALEGYKGHDEFNFVENTFIRRFPVYNGDTKTDKTRQFQYKLKPGEAMKQLVLDKTTEY